MRQVYSSPRHENIERMVALFSEHGIETQVTALNAYRTRGYKRFSYSRDKDPDVWPKVWVVHSEDQTRARELMRDVGIEPTSRHSHVLEAERKAAATQPRGVSSRLRTALLVIIGILVLLMLWRRFG